MRSVKVFASQRNEKYDGWGSVASALADMDIRVHTEPCDCDVSIALGGEYINPLILKGKKVLIFSSVGWSHQFDALYGKVLTEYYDEMHDMTKASVKGCADHIKGLIEKYEAD